MEQKLADYRAKKEKVEKLDKIKATFDKVLGFGLRNRMANKATSSESNIELEEHLIESEDTESEDEALEDEDIDKIDCFSSKELIIYLTIFITWSIFFVIFIKLEFGAVYFIVTALIGMYFNTRTRKKGRREMSAYSVFNKNCKSIDGTLTAEQLERQMVMGQLI